MMRRGQVALYLLMTIVVLAVVAFMNVDIFLTVRAKNRVQNAGDAAALAAARKQGELLNRIGRLNIDHILAAVENDSEKCREIEFEQKRIALLEPIEALREANEAAKENGAEPREDFVQLLKEHIETIRTVYSGAVDSDVEPYPEPWPGAWVEYASAIEQVADGGLAIGPDNNEYYYVDGSHLLLNQSFYSAVAGRCWCWFRYHNAENALRDYGGWSSWAPIPRRKSNSIGNSEVFSLHVEARPGALAGAGGFSFEEIAAMASKWGGRPVSQAEVQGAAELTNAAAVWFYLDSSAWSQWFDGLRLLSHGNDDADDFPIVGEVKREYNVRGAATACRCIMKAPGVLHESESDVSWFAAAKPFGKIVDDVSGDEPVTAKSGLVLPVFEAVRLIPVDAIPGGSLGTADMTWVHHMRYHIPEYLQNGPNRNGGCYYCQLLCTWEEASFHQEAGLWLDLHSGTCERGSGPAYSHGGHGH